MGSNESLRGLVVMGRYAAKVILLGLFTLVALPTAATAANGDCGQPASTGSTPRASDALHVLRNAVGLVPCELCVCDADGSGQVRASDALRVLRIAVGQDLDLLCAACSGGPIDINNLVSDEVDVTTISALAGGSVEVRGATLTVPPGALMEDAQIGLVAVPFAGIGIPEGDPALGGQVPISDHAFLIFTDRAVELLAPLVLELPFDPDAVDPLYENSDFHVTAATGPFLVPQGPPSVVDRDAAVIRFSIDAASLAQNFGAMTTGAPPLGAGASFAGIVAKLGGVSLSGVLGAVAVGLAGGSQWHVFIATLDDVKQLVSTFATLTWDERFKLRYREGLVSFGDVVEVGMALAEAHDLFVDEMGMELPNLIDLDGYYTVYLDELANHFFVKSPGGVAPDGFTTPGSGLVEGASYINVAKNEGEWPSIAVHEYFHALQYGSLNSIFMANNLEAVFNPTSVFLFEGSATAVAGRLIFGNGSNAHRSEFLTDELPQIRSIWTLEQADPPDVAQEFFVYLEKSFGDTDFYVEVFENLGSGLLSGFEDKERAVAAIDAMLAASGDGSDSISEAWGDFVEDRTILNLDDYAVNAGTLRFDVQKVVPRDGTVAEDRETVPPLSYRVLKLVLPGIDTIDPEADTRRDFEIGLLVFGDTKDFVRVWLVGEALGVRSPEEVTFDDANLREFVTFPAARAGSSSREVFVIIANTNPAKEGSFSLDVQARNFSDGFEPPTGREADLEVCVNVNILREFIGADRVEDFCFGNDGLGGLGSSTFSVNFDKDQSNFETRGSMTGTTNSPTTKVATVRAEIDGTILSPQRALFNVIRFEAHDIPLEDVFMGSDSNPFDTYFFRASGAGVCDLIDLYEYDSPAGFFEVTSFDCSEDSEIIIEVDRPRDPS